METKLTDKQEALIKAADQVIRLYGAIESRPAALAFADGAEDA